MVNVGSTGSIIDDIVRILRLLIMAGMMTGKSITCSPVSMIEDKGSKVCFLESFGKAVKEM